MEGFCNEEVEVCRGADSICPVVGGDRHEVERGIQEDGHKRGHVPEPQRHFRRMEELGGYKYSLNTLYISKGFLIIEQYYRQNSFHLFSR